MSNQKSIDEFVNEVQPLIQEVISYELLERGITPSQTLHIQKRQLAQALLAQYNGQNVAFNTVSSVLENLRSCGDLLTRLGVVIYSQFRTAQSVKGAQQNVLVILSRLNRICPTSQEEMKVCHEQMEQAKSLMQVQIQSASNTAQSNIVHQNVNVQQQQQGVPQHSAQISAQNLTNANHVPMQSSNYSIPPRVPPRVNGQNASMHYTANEQFNNQRHSTPRNGPVIDDNMGYVSNIFSNLLLHQNTNQQANLDGNTAYSLPHSNPFEDPQHNVNQAHVSSNYLPRQQGCSVWPNSDVYRPKQVPIYKWNVRFSGSGKDADVFVFLQTVKSKARAQSVTNAELFTKTSEFFSGFASKWFHSQQFYDWNDLESKLISDFVQVDYFDNLLDIIRQRKQSQNETVV